MKNNLKKHTHIPSVGFISPPAWSDPSPYEFTTVVKEQVITQQAPLLLPDFDYSLESIASELIQQQFTLCAKSLKASGCDLVIQVGSPFAWAKVNSEAQARQRNTNIEKTANIPSVMTTLAIIDALRAFQVKNISISCTYYETDWKNQFSHFLNLCDFNVLHASNLTDQGLIAQNENVFEYAWKMTDEIIKDSVASVKKATPNTEAIVITGTGARTLGILTELEEIAQCPVIPADTVLYWMIAQQLNLQLLPKMGHFQTLSITH